MSSGANIADKTTLTGVSLGSGSVIMEKVRISNSIIMDNVTIMPGSIIEVSRISIYCLLSNYYTNFSNYQDSIICDGVTVGEKTSLKGCLVGKGQSIEHNSQVSSQTLLDKDRMMEV